MLILPLAVTLIALAALPDQVPMHYNAAGVVNRWGSKYENLIFPAINLVIGLLYLAFRAGYRRNTKSEQDKVLWLMGCGMLFVFNVMTIMFLGQAWQGAQWSESGPLDFSRIMFTATGVLFIAMGNLLPKLRRNGLFGVRTTWSRKSDENWRASQVAGGVGLMVVGVVLVVGNLFFVKEEQSMAFSLIGILLMIPALLLVLWMIEKRKTEDN